VSGELRMRVFAGPNGSGKSTIINDVRNHKANGIPVDFGIYVNADDIAKSLLTNEVSFANYDIQTTVTDFVESALISGLIGARFTEHDFLSSFVFNDNSIRLIKASFNEHLAQVLADFIRKKLLQTKKKFSFETVFSHESKLQIMRDAVVAGYKVYLYFVCTEDPQINVFRVKKVRVHEGGHDVPENKITERYYRSLELLHEASQLAYQAYFFNNSDDEYELFANFKNVNHLKRWTHKNDSSIPNWFRKYYSAKSK
jgi:predicted ABC-type ATPase